MYLSIGIGLSGLPMVDWTGLDWQTACFTWYAKRQRQEICASGAFCMNIACISGSEDCTKKQSTLEYESVDSSWPPWSYLLPTIRNNEACAEHTN
jgi:hypothetical protein